MTLPCSLTVGPGGGCGEEQSPAQMTTVALLPWNPLLRPTAKVSQLQPRLTSGPLHLLFPVPGLLFSQLSERLSPFPPSGLSWGITLSVKPSLAAVFKLATHWGPQWEVPSEAEADKEGCCGQGPVVSLGRSRSSRAGRLWIGKRVWGQRSCLWLFDAVPGVTRAGG